MRLRSLVSMSWPVLALIVVLPLTAQASILDQRARELLSDVPQFTGPNCFGTSMRALGVLGVRRYVSPEEMRETVSRHCIASERTSGSLGLLVEATSGDLVHAFVVLDESSVLTKNGLSKRSSNEIQSEQVMRSIHHRAMSTQCRVQGRPDCRMETQYFLCEGFEVPTQTEVLLHDLLESHERMFSSEGQELFFQTAVAGGQNSELCGMSSGRWFSIRDSVEFATYATITAEGRARLEDLKRRLIQARQTCPSPRHD